jgi:hypothetical protein
MERILAPRLGRRGVRIMSLIGTALLVLGITGWWLSSRILSDDGFADVVAKTSQQSAVRDYIGDEASIRQARSSDFVSAARPIVSQAIAAAINTPPVTSAIRQFAASAHAQLFRLNDARRVDIDASQATVTIRAALQSADPVLAEKLPPSVLNSAATVSQSKTIDVIAQAGIWIEILYIPTVLAGLGLLLLSCLWSRDRTHAVRFAGFTFMLAGSFPVGLALATPLFATIGGADSNPGRGAAVAAFVRVLLERLVTSGWTLILIGLLLAVAAGRDGGHLADRWARFCVWFERSRIVFRWRLGAAAGVITVAALMMTWPLTFLRDVLFLGGIVVLYIGIVFALRVAGLLVPGAPTMHVRKRQFGAVALAMVSIFLVTTAATAVAVTATRPSTRANPTASGCNGFIALCDERLDQIVWPASHNAMNSAAYNFYQSEQTLSITDQLNAGVKVLLLDVYYGYQENGIVRTNLAGGINRTTLNSDIGASGVEALNRLGALTGAVDTSGKKQDLYFCHDYCELGAVKAVTVLKEIKAYLDRNPTDVLMLDFEDYVQPADIEKALKQADLFDSIYPLPTSGPLPTLLNMVSVRSPDDKPNPRRLIVTSERHANQVPWMPGTYNLMQETPFTFNSVSSFTCDPNRGLTSNPMLLVNHWLRTSGPPDPVGATTVNSEATLTARMQQCIAQRGSLPNILAVDFIAVGDLISTVNQFNAAIAQLTGVTKFWTDALSGNQVGRNLSEAERQQAAVSTRLPSTTDAAARKLLGAQANRLQTPDLVKDLNQVTVSESDTSGSSDSTGSPSAGNPQPESPSPGPPSTTLPPSTAVTRPTN